MDARSASKAAPGAVVSSPQAAFDDLLVHVCDLRDQLFDGGRPVAATCDAIRDLAAFIRWTDAPEPFSLPLQFATGRRHEAPAFRTEQ
jgi:hypothetical protein